MYYSDDELEAQVYELLAELAKGDPVDVTPPIWRQLEPEVEYA